MSLSTPSERNEERDKYKTWLIFLEIITLYQNKGISSAYLQNRGRFKISQRLLKYTTVSRCFIND